MRQSSRGYGIFFGIGLTGLTAAAMSAFWAVTGSEVRRSAAEAAEANRRVVVEAPRDTAPAWQPEPEAALLDTLYLLRAEGRLGDALKVLERWLAAHPDDRPRRLDAARLAFEAARRERGVVHYRTYLIAAPDRDVLLEAVSRVLSEFQPQLARDALARLLRVDDGQFTVRLGLARATAEAENPAEAERILGPIPPFALPEADALRLQVRRALNPSIDDARRWVEEYPRELHYRLVLARALRRADLAGESVGHYLAALDADTSLALRAEAADAAVAAEQLTLASALLEDVLERDSTNDAALLSYARVRARLGDDAGAVTAFERLMARAPSEERFIEARGVLFEVQDVTRTLPLLARLVAFRPSDDALRLRYAQDLERSESPRAAEAQYDTLLLRQPTAALHLARARLRTGRNVLPLALDDAAAAEALDPTAEAAWMQGEIHRWREERELSRQAYARAAARDPNDPRIAEGQRLLAVQRRTALGWEPAFGNSVLTQGLGDSDGFGSYRLRAQRGFDPFVREDLLIVGAEVRQVTGGVRARSALGGDVGLLRTIGRVALTGRIGALAFSEGPTAPTAQLEALDRSPTRTLRAALTHEPAYETLRSAGTVRDDAPLTATAAAASISQQVTARLDLFVQGEHAALSDGNNRQVAAAALRFAATPTIGVLYLASAARVAEGTADYWSPQRFVTQGIALDLRRNRREGWSVGARLAPSYAWVRETAPGRPAGLQSAFQALATADAWWRGGAWEVGITGGYGQDRAGTYAASFGSIQARLRP